MKTVISIGAHPDDIEIGCGGTELILRKNGYRLIHIIASYGEEGDMDTPPHTLAKQRKSEAYESAKIIGVDEVIFLNIPDGSHQYSKENKLDLMKLIRSYRPNIIFTHASCDHFPDHSMVHQLSMSAIQAAKGPWYPNAGENPHHVSTVYGYEVWHPINKHQYTSDISQHIELKMLALSKHRSQISKTNYVEAIHGLAKYRGITTMAGSYAEAFEILVHNAEYI